MGDRCALEVKINRADVHFLVESFGDYWDEEIHHFWQGDPLNFVTLEQDEMYPEYDEFKRLAELTNITFIVEHGHSWTYGGEQFAAYEGQMLTVEIDQEGCLIVEIDEDTGQPLPGPLADMQNFLALKKLAQKHLDQPDSATAWARAVDMIPERVGAPLVWLQRATNFLPGYLTD